jgi:hypothetical protein
VLTSEGVSLSVLTSGARLQAGRSVLKKPGAPMPRATV